MTRDLPTGRHHLTPDEVARNQRARMLAALGRCVAEKGFAATTVADIIRGAKVSRQTFYAQFTDKQDCFMVAFDAAHAAVSASIAVAPAESTPRGRFAAALAGYLDAIGDDPDMGRVYLIAVFGAGPDALRRRTAVQQELVTTLSEAVGARTADDRFACRALLAASAAMVAEALLDGRDPDDVRRLHGPLTALAARMLG